MRDFSFPLFFAVPSLGHAVGSDIPFDNRGLWAVGGDLQTAHRAICRRFNYSGEILLWVGGPDSVLNGGKQQKSLK